MSQGSAGPGEILVGGILPPFPSELTAYALEFAPGQRQRGADQRHVSGKSPRISNAAQSVGARAAQQAHQKGLQLVPPVVSRRYKAAPVPVRHPDEGLVPQPPGRAFQVSPSRPDADPLFRERNSKATRELPRGIPVRKGEALRTEIMHDMGKDKEAPRLRNSRAEGDR
jgi:hypothetical protein